MKILEKVSEAKWQFGHSSYAPEDPRYRLCHQFWKIEFHEDKFFTDHLLNIIQERTNQSYICEHVYANGQTYGLDGTLHQDYYNVSGSYLFSSVFPIGTESSNILPNFCLSLLISFRIKWEFFILLNN